MASQFKLLPFILFIAVVFCSACNEAPKQMGMPPAVVSIEPVRVGPFKEKSDYLGNVKSRKSITLSPNVEGHITSIEVTAGQTVPAGARIMRIDSRMQAAQTDAIGSAADSVRSDLSNAEATLRSLQNTLISKQANVEYTKSQHGRYRTLQSEGAVSMAELDSWNNNYKAAVAERDAVQQQIEAQKMTIQKYQRSHHQAVSNWQAQKENLRYYNIVAPFAGTVGDIPVKLGDRVTSDTALTTLTENHPLEVYISIPAEKASVMQKGMKVQLVSTDGVDYGSSELIFISPTVDSNSQTVLIKTLYPNAKSMLRADQTVRAQILWKTREGLSVPTSAVMQAAGKYFVFTAVETAGKLSAKQVEIEVLGIEGDAYQVKSGLKKTDKIVTTGIQRLADGAPIMEKPQGVKPDSTAQNTQSDQTVH